MTGVRLVGALAISAISLVAMLWYLKKKKPQRRSIEKKNRTENASSKEKESKSTLRHIPSQPLLANDDTKPLLSVDNTKRIELQSDKQNEIMVPKGIEQEVERQEEILVQEVSILQSNEKLSQEDKDNLQGSVCKSQKHKNIENFLNDELLERDSIQQDDLLLDKSTNNLNKSSCADDSDKNVANSNAYQNFTNEIDETMNSESFSVLNEAMTASRMGDISFVNKQNSERNGKSEQKKQSEQENEIRERSEQETIYDLENEIREKSEQELNEQDALSVSTMVPLLESTNLDVTCSQPRENDVDDVNDVIKPENSIKLESSSVCETSRDISKEDNSSHSLLHNDSKKRSRNDSNCSSHSAGHINDRSSDTGSDNTASPLKDRNSISPSKDSQGIVENGIQNSDTSNCDSASIDSDRGSNGCTTENLRTGKLIYRCNFPTELCGRLIGKYGKNINFIKEKANANVTLNTNPFTRAFQLCTIEGTQRQIDTALNMISKRFPDVDLRPVDVPTLNDPQPPVSNPVIMPEIMQLQLPEGVSVDVVVSSIVDAGHIFLQQPTHPSFPSLERLNQFMNACYMQDGIVPQLPRPLEVGVICAAPIMEGWYRSQVTAVYEGPDECDIKYVDYGGFSRVSGSVLRQIRSDFMTLPFQGIECYMANITPLQDEEYFSSEAAAVLEELTQGKLLQAQVVGRNEDGIAYCHIYQINGDKVTFVNRELVNRGVVRWIEILS